MEEEKKEGLARVGIVEMLSSDGPQDCTTEEKECDVRNEVELKQLPILRAILMATLYATLYLPTLNQTVISTALPKILSDINKFGSDIGYTWVGSAYALAQAMSLPLFGHLGHAPGRKWALLAAMAVFMLGSILCGTAVNIGMLLAARTIQGLGAGGISGLMFVLLAEMARVRGVGKYHELMGASCAVVTAVGPLVGGTLAERASWRWCFFLNVPICAICTTIICILLPQCSTTATTRYAMRLFDLGGITAIGIGKVLVALAIQWAIQNQTWQSPQVLITLISGVAALVGFFPVEVSAPSPVIPLGFFHRRTRIGAYLAVFFHSIAFSGLNYWLPLYFQAVRQQTASESGLSMLPWTLSFAIISAATGILIIAMRRWVLKSLKYNRFRQQLIYLRYLEFIWAGFLIASVALACLTLLKPDTSLAITLILLALAGLGVGPNFNSPLFPIHASFDMADSNYAATLSQSTSTYAFIRSLGSSVGITASGLVFFEDLAENQLPSLSVFNLTQAIEHSNLLSEVEEQANVKVLYTAMQHVFFQVCMCMAVGLFLSLMIRRHPFSNDTSEEDRDGECRAVPRVDSFGPEDG